MKISIGRATHGKQISSLKSMVRNRSAIIIFLLIAIIIFIAFVYLGSLGDEEYIGQSPRAVKAIEIIENEMNEDSQKTINYTLYTVVPGDTAWDISLKYGVSMNELFSINSIPRARSLRIGQILKIPVKEK